MRVLRRIYLDDVIVASTNIELNEKDEVNSPHAYIGHIEYIISNYTFRKYKTE